MTWTQPVSAKILCAGQGCADRDGCQRYRNRGRGEYASFDIERQRYAGPCVHRIEIVRRMDAA